MSDEPDMIIQNSSIRTRRERDLWLIAQNREARDKGMTHARYSYDEVRRLNLVEYWRTTPDDQGEPRFTDVPGQANRDNLMPAPWTEDKF